MIRFIKPIGGSTEQGAIAVANGASQALAAELCREGRGGCDEIREAYRRRDCLGGLLRWVHPSEPAATPVQAAEAATTGALISIAV
jgi:hypothetical protein